MSAKQFDSVFRPGLFAGQVVLVTGGGTGIGRCTAHELAALGAQVVIASRKLDVLERTAGEIAESGGRCDVVQLDVRDQPAVDAALQGIVERHGRLDGVVHNAGGQFVAPAEKITPNGWRTVIDLNLNATFWIASAAYRHWMRDHGGAIVCMLADIWTGYPAMAHMSAARAGIENLTWTLAMEWAPSDIRINCIAPGTILSSGMLTYPPKVQEFTAREARSAPASRLGTESEVSAGIVFLLSPAAAYITGETLCVDGGARLHKSRLLPVGQHAGSRRWDGFHLRADYSGTPFAEPDDDQEPPARHNDAAARHFPGMRCATLERLAGTLAALALLAPTAGAAIGLEPVVPDLLAIPTFMTYAPGDPTRLFYLEKNTGNVRIIDTATHSLLPDPFLTVPVSTSSEQGLLGLAFHPDYASNGHFFLNRTDPAGDTRIERYQVSATDPNRADPTPTELVFIDQPQQNHNGGWIGFGPDGYLYATSGDGGNFNDLGPGHFEPGGNAQDTSDGQLLGKILRLDVDTPPPLGQSVAVPASNPFVGVAGDDRIWAYGLRNPWRASFDRETGDFWVGDVGQNAVEEIDFQPAGSAGGENYGWRLREGTIATPGLGTGGPAPPGAIEPVHTYLHEGARPGRSVVGGYVYRGPIEELQGQYFFADSVTNQIWSITFDGSDPEDFDGSNFVSFIDWTDELRPPGGFTLISSFAEDMEGNLYVIDLGGFGFLPRGRIYQVVPEPGTAALMALGLATLARSMSSARLRLAARA